MKIEGVVCCPSAGRTTGISERERAHVLVWRDQKSGEFATGIGYSLSLKYVS
jgi:hypothetical protein